MTKTNENLSSTEPWETFISKGENYAFRPLNKPKNHSRRWKHTKPDLTVFCSLCAEQLTIKYIPPKKQYSQKNNWGYWTGKKVFQDKHICDNCLVDIHHGGIINWVDNLEKADIFYTYNFTFIF